MVNTRSSNVPEEPVVQQSESSSDPLAAIAAKLDSLNEISARIAALEAASANYNDRGKRHMDEGRRRSHWEEDSEDDYKRRGRRPPYTKIEFPKFSGGDPRRWILKAEKFFLYYQTPEDSKVDVASMSLEGDALDLFSWVHSERTMLYWDELVKTLQEHYGPPEYQNPDKYLASVQHDGPVQEYRQEFAKRVARVHNWPEHCLLGIFLNGLKEELKADVRIQKPRTVYKAASLALEFEKKSQLSCGPKLNSSYTQNRLNMSQIPSDPTHPL